MSLIAKHRSGRKPRVRVTNSPGLFTSGKHESIQIEKPINNPRRVAVVLRAYGHLNDITDMTDQQNSYVI